MVLGERSKVGIRGIKGKFKERERDFLTLEDPGEKLRKRRNQREGSKREKREDKP